jgi:hypothetical protein
MTGCVTRFAEIFVPKAYGYKSRVSPCLSYHAPCAGTFRGLHFVRLWTFILSSFKIESFEKSLGIKSLVMSERVLKSVSKDFNFEIKFESREIKSECHESRNLIFFYLKET